MNVYGARTIAGLTVDAIAKEIPELAKYVRHYDYVVAQDGTGDFFTVQEAINAVPDFRKNVRTTILVRKGTYKEKIIIPESKINISLIGEDGAVLTMMTLPIRKMCLVRIWELRDRLVATFMLPISMRRTSLLKTRQDR